MPREGKCPRCLYKASLISFIEAAGDGKLIPVFQKLPAGVQAYYLSYMSLFRPKSGSAIQLDKVARLTADLVELVTLPYVHVQGRVDRPCTSKTWAMAMEQMIEQAPGLTLPMKNHNYLKSIAWDVADKADRNAEKTHDSNAQHRRQQPDRSAADPLLDPMEKARREWDKKHGAPSATIDLKGLSKVVKGME
ncbi:MAG: hypothetical protein VR65_19910 [Desulfobulbaceae bacterium BRH_c16a]|nr:MAG: hypothetical protein VR65_19910 [Desulfobulbaceae bacterium BRH_c16a]